VKILYQKIFAEFYKEFILGAFLIATKKEKGEILLFSVCFMVFF